MSAGCQDFQFIVEINEACRQSDFSTIDASRLFANDNQGPGFRCKGLLVPMDESLKRLWLHPGGRFELENASLHGGMWYWCEKFERHNDRV